MQAIVWRRYGPPADVLELGEAPTPQIKDHEVLVRVKAASVHIGDWLELNGTPYLIRLASGIRKPRRRTPGRDLAGRVEAVGSKVTVFRPGDEVYGEGKESLAEFAAVPEKVLAHKPADLTFEQAAAVPLSATAALQALRDRGKIAPGHRVLINGASGGLGTYAVQIAKAMGAEVTGVCSTSNIELVRSLGADHVIDYTREDFTVGDERYDLIIDNAGVHSLAELRRALNRQGTLIPNNGTQGGRWMGTIGRTLGALVMSPFVSHRLRPFLALPSREDLLALTELIEAGKVTPVVDRTFPLTETAEAFDHVGGGHARGKTVVTV